MNQRLVQFIGPAVVLALFAIVLGVLHRELSAHSVEDILARLRAIPTASLVLAVVATVASYLALTGYDALSLRYIGKQLPYRQTGLASFTAYAFANNIGFAFLGATAVRLRLYTAFGLQTSDVARIAAMNATTFWLGVCVLGGLSFVLGGVPLPPKLGVSPLTIRVIGAVLLAAALAYLILNVVRKSPLHVRGAEIPVPGPTMAVSQAGLGLLDWLLASAVFYTLLPPSAELGYWPIVATFIAAQVIGLASNVPGGLGVFDGIVVFVVGQHTGTDVALGTLVAYRIIYYFLPLLAAVAAFGFHEAYRHREQIGKAGAVAILGANVVVPRVMAVGVFLSGVVLLVSAVLPGEITHIERLSDIGLLAVVEASHVGAALAGAALLILARGIWDRVSSAYYATLWLLGSGIVLSLLKGFDYHEALVLGIMLVSLLPCRRHFFRPTARMLQSLSATWLAALLFVGVGLAGLAAWAHGSILDLGGLVGFGADEHASRTGRALLLALGLAGVYALSRLTRLAPHEEALPTKEDLAAARPVIERSPASASHLALLGDKYLLFNEPRTAFLMFGISRRSWVALGDPVGDPEDRAELVWRFRERSYRHGGKPVFYEVSAENLPLYVDLGLSLHKLGEEARVSLEEFTLQGKAYKRLRQVVNKMQREAFGFEVLDLPAVQIELPRLEAISDAWLAEKSTREKGFSLGFFDRAYVAQTPVAVIKKRDEIVAFANLWLGGRTRGAVHRPHALRRGRPERDDGVPVHRDHVVGAGAGFPVVQHRHGAVLGSREPSARSGVAPGRHGAVPARRAFLQLPGTAPLQGEVQAALGAALPGVARWNRAPGGARRGVGAHQRRRGRRLQKVARRAGSSSPGSSTRYAKPAIIATVRTTLGPARRTRPGRV